MKIALTQRIFYHKQRPYDALEHGWYSFLKDHSLFPVANDPTQDFKTLARDFDLLIITGGNDPVPRRITETRFATEMMKLQKPVIGVCHGAFLLTDILGGKVDDCSYHMDTEHIVITADGAYNVNSYHDYQITKPHDSATVIASDPDGYCEAWVDGNLAGIVWHPERMDVPYVPNEIKKFFGDI